MQSQAAAPLQWLGTNINVHRARLLGTHAHCSSRCQGLGILPGLDGLRGGFAGSLHTYILAISLLGTGSGPLG